MVTRWFVHEQLHKEIPLCKIIEQCPATDIEEIIEGVREYLKDLREGKNKESFIPVYGRPLVFRPQDEIIEARRRERKENIDRLRKMVEKIKYREEI